MPIKACSDEEFISLVKSVGPAETARVLGIAVRNVYDRRRRLERVLGEPIASPGSATSDYPRRVELDLDDGVILIGSDPHYWPDKISTAHRGFVKFASELKPKIIILNGDVSDGAETSRHPPIMWAKPPTVKEECGAIDLRLDEIRKAAPKSAKLFWTIGNHDARFESSLASNAKQFRGMHGFRLKDHFPHWDICWSIWINDSLVVKHRFKGGVHATHNNAINSGKSMATGHLHSLKVTPFSDYNGTRFGIDSGTLADPYGEQFEYSEENPLNHRSGFIVLTFHDGQLLWPEIAAVVDSNHIQFRGQVIKV